MQASDATAVVESYLDAVVAREHERVRGLLADRGFVYDSPIARFSCADDYVQYLALTSAILRRIERRHAFADGDDVCHWLVIETQLSERVATHAAQWARVADGRICFLEMLFDPYRYRLLFEVQD
jgi:hypothetical protein